MSYAQDERDYWSQKYDPEPYECVSPFGVIYPGHSFGWEDPECMVCGTEKDDEQDDLQCGKAK